MIHPPSGIRAHRVPFFIVTSLWFPGAAFGNGNRSETLWTQSLSTVTVNAGYLSRIENTTFAGVILTKIPIIEKS